MFLTTALDPLVQMNRTFEEPKHTKIEVTGPWCSVSPSLNRTIIHEEETATEATSASPGVQEKLAWKTDVFNKEKVEFQTLRNALF